MKTILMMGCALALLFAAVPQPVMAANSQMNLTVGTTNDAKAGDTVTVRLVGSNNPGLSTFAARLAYDDSDLEYVGTTWANTISSDSGNIELVSPVTENNQQALNLSAILIKAKNAYTTMPVTLTVREVTDASYNPVTVTTVVDASAGQTQSQSQSQSTSQSQSDSQDDTEYTDDIDDTDDTDSYDDTDDTQDSQSSSGNTHKTSSNKKNNSGNTSKNGNRTDATPKTGAVDLRMVFGAAVIVFLLAAAGCIRFLNKKKE